MKQKFKGTPLPMLVAALTVTENFTSNKAVLIEEQPQWKDPFITTYIAVIQAFMKEHFGINTKAQVKEATRVVNQMQEAGSDNLAMLKKQIERNFRDNKPRLAILLDTLGFKAHWSKAIRKSQTELIGLLLAFSNNLTPELRAELEGKNVNATRITTAIGHADALNKANITQETLKGSSKLVTEASIKAMNEIYDKAMDICEIGKKLFKADKNRQDLFVFSKLLAQQESGTTKPAAKEKKESAA